MPRQIDALMKHLGVGDITSAVRSAHTIKGVAANVNAEALRAIALQMELAARAQDPEKLELLMPELMDRFEELKQTLVQ